MVSNRFYTYIKESATLGLPYGVILLFGAFGPATTLLLDMDERNILGTIFLFAISLSMIFTPIKLFKNRYFKIFLIIYTTAVSLAVIIFPMVLFIYKIVIILSFGINLGLFARIWAFKIQNTPPMINKIKLLVGVLLISYGLLYIGNITFPSLSTDYVTVIPGLLLLLTLPLYLKLPNFSYNTQKETNTLGTFPSKVLIIIYIIFISAGFTYVGIYPELLKYQPYERFYNVLPFLLTLFFIPSLINKFKQRSLLYLGITFLGISYCFFLFKPSTSIYFFIQSFLQPGWAFLDFFAWILGIEIARISNKPQYINKTVGAFLLGTFTGAVFYQLLDGFFPINSPIFLFISIIPLFMVIPLFFYTYQKFIDKTVAENTLPLDILSKREHEIAQYLINGKTQKEIMEITNISKNTLKTHCRNIYRKLGVDNKKDLIKRNSKETVFNI